MQGSSAIWLRQAVRVVADSLKSHIGRDVCGHRASVSEELGCSLAVSTNLCLVLGFASSSHSPVAAAPS